VTDALTSAVVALNAGANALAAALYPIGAVPGWLSVTLVAVTTGAAALVAFKYTSNQRAIRSVRRGIRADLLAVKLFKNDIRVGLRSQGRVLVGAVRLLLLALVPVLAMAIPMSLLLAQLGAWYQAAPVPVGEETVVTVALTGDRTAPFPDVGLEPSEGAEDLSGPVRIFSKREVCWNVRARRPGYHRLRFRIGGEAVEKELAVGTGLMRVSPIRPGWNWLAALEYPREKPFGRGSAVRSVEIEYPTRSSWTHGTGAWMVYLFAVSLVAGFCLRGVVGVDL
jgi:hypothetical protein